jgi:hypothetical protein
MEEGWLGRMNRFETAQAAARLLSYTCLAPLLRQGFKAAQRSGTHLWSLFSLASSRACSVSDRSPLVLDLLGTC